MLAAMRSPGGAYMRSPGAVRVVRGGAVTEEGVCSTYDSILIVGNKIILGGFSLLPTTYEKQATIEKWSLITKKMEGVYYDDEVAHINHPAGYGTTYARLLSVDDDNVWGWVSTYSNRTSWVGPGSVGNPPHGNRSLSVRPHNRFDIASWTKDDVVLDTTDKTMPMPCGGYLYTPLGKFNNDGEIEEQPDPFAALRYQYPSSPGYIHAAHAVGMSSEAAILRQVAYLAPSTPDLQQAWPGLYPWPGDIASTLEEPPIDCELLYPAFNEGFAVMYEFDGAYYSAKGSASVHAVCNIVTKMSVTAGGIWSFDGDRFSLLGKKLNTVDFEVAPRIIRYGDYTYYLHSSAQSNGLYRVDTDTHENVSVLDYSDLFEDNYGLEVEEDWITGKKRIRFNDMAIRGNRLYICGGFKVDNISEPLWRGFLMIVNVDNFSAVGLRITPTHSRPFT